MMEIINPEKKLVCSDCPKSIDENKYKYSTEKFKRPLCWDCQAVEKKKLAENPTEKKIVNNNRNDNLIQKTIRTNLGESEIDFDRKVNSFKNEDNVRVKYVQSHIAYNPEARNFNYFAVVFYEKKL